MAKLEQVVLEAANGDRYQMLSHFYQLWRRPEFCSCQMEGTPLDGEENAGISLDPGIEEIPFCLLVGQMPLRSLILDTPDIMLSADMSSGRILAICVTKEAAVDAQIMKEEMGLLRRPRTHVKPDMVIEHISHRKDMQDPLPQLFERARQVPYLKGKLYVSLEGENRYALCGQSLPARSQGAFYGFDRASRSFVAYDTFSDILVGYGSVKSVAELR